MIEHEAADSYPPAPNLARKVADLAASIEAKDAEIERLRNDLSFWKRHAPAEIARLAKANQEWCDKWERMVCEYCGWRQNGEVTHD